MAHLLLCGLSLFSQFDWYKFVVVRLIVKIILSYMQCLMISVTVYCTSSTNTLTKFIIFLTEMNGLSTCAFYYEANINK